MAIVPRQHAIPLHQAQDPASLDASDPDGGYASSLANRRPSRKRSARAGSLTVARKNAKKTPTSDDILITALKMVLSAITSDHKDLYMPACNLIQSQYSYLDAGLRAAVKIGFASNPALALTFMRVSEDERIAYFKSVARARGYNWPVMSGMTVNPAHNMAPKGGPMAES